jgi:hypothetical protein
MMPTAWEETSGTGVGTGIVTPSGVGGVTDIEWALSADILPTGVSAYAAWSPLPDGSKPNDKASGGAQHAVDGHGWDVVLMYDNPFGMMEGLNLFGGYSWIDQVGDAQETIVAGFTYAIGGVTLGYQHSLEDNPAVNNNADQYENNFYGVSFNVNDDLSVSYGVGESTKEIAGSADVEAEATSIQIAYSLGGASIKLAETEIENQNYGTTDTDGTTIAVSLAF